jgi:hypothetical protein
VGGESTLAGFGLLLATQSVNTLRQRITADALNLAVKVNGKVPKFLAHLVRHLNPDSYTIGHFRCSLAHGGKSYQ